MVYLCNILCNKIICKSIGPALYNVIICTGHGIKGKQGLGGIPRHRSSLEAIIEGAARHSAEHIICMWICFKLRQESRTTITTKEYTLKVSTHRGCPQGAVKSGSE
jgi:hypothetical protein